MALDGITTELLAHELDRELKGSRIDKVFQPDKHTVILHIRSEGKIKKLLISINPSAPRIHITSSARENPMMPPSFCMLLRKYLSGAKIESITNPGYERIVEIRVSATDELHDTKEIRLIAELMGRYSNLILVNPGGKILDSIIHVDYSISRVREVMPARIYEYPPSQDKMTPDEALEKVKGGELPVIPEESGRPVCKAILNSVKGMSPILARQIAVKADVDERIPAKGLSSDEKKRMTDRSKKLFEKIINRDYVPAVYYTEDGSAADFSPFDLAGFPKMVLTDSVSSAIDLYYSDKDRMIDIDNKRRMLLRIVDAALSHAAHKAEIHMQDHEEGKKADIYRKYGDLLLSNAYKYTEKTDSVTCEDYYEDPPCDITIPLDPTLTVNDNAQEYYRRSRKAKRKYELAVRYIEDDKLALDYLRSLKTAAEASSCDDDITAVAEELRSLSTQAPAKKKTDNINPNTTVGKAKSGKASSRALREAARKAEQRRSEKRSKERSKPLPLRRYETDDGYTILSGRNNIQNDELTFRSASGNDWWFHVKGVPGTHVILKAKAGEDMPSDNAVIKAASLAAYFSRSVLIEEHQAGGADPTGKIKAEVDYCPVSHVKKIPGARPGMVIYEGYYSIIVPAEEP